MSQSAKKSIARDLGVPREAACPEPTELGRVLCDAIIARLDYFFVKVRRPFSIIVSFSDFFEHHQEAGDGGLL